MRHDSAQYRVDSSAPALTPRPTATSSATPHASIRGTTVVPASAELVAAEPTYIHISPHMPVFFEPSRLVTTRETALLACIYATYTNDAGNIAPNTSRIQMTVTTSFNSPTPFLNAIGTSWYEGYPFDPPRIWFDGTASVTTTYPDVPEGTQFGLTFSLYSDWEATVSWEMSLVLLELAPFGPSA